MTITVMMMLVTAITMDTEAAEREDSRCVEHSLCVAC